VNKQTIVDFDPTIYSKEECNWLLENLDKPVPVAMATIRPYRMPPDGKNKNNVVYPDGVNPNAVKPILDRIQELEDFQNHEGQKWVGKEAIKACIRTWLTVDAKWESDNRRTRGRAPRYPSLYSFDSRGKGHLGGPGSDNGGIKTYFDDKGERKPIAIALIPEEVVEWSPGFTETPATKDMVVNVEMSRIECFCGHTEKFKKDSRPSHNAARARFSKHLRGATEDVERHRELYTVEFKG
jgi:hypothetical protein